MVRNLGQKAGECVREQLQAQGPRPKTSHVGPVERDERKAKVHVGQGGVDARQMAVYQLPAPREEKQGYASNSFDFRRAAAA